MNLNYEVLHSMDSPIQDGEKFITQYKVKVKDEDDSLRDLIVTIKSKKVLTSNEINSHIQSVALLANIYKVGPSEEYKNKSIVIRGKKLIKESHCSQSGTKIIDNFHNDLVDKVQKYSNRIKSAQQNQGHGAHFAEIQKYTKKHEMVLNAFHHIVEDNIIPHDEEDIPHIKAETPLSVEKKGGVLEVNSTSHVVTPQSRPSELRDSMIARRSLLTSISPLDAKTPEEQGKVLEIDRPSFDRPINNVLMGTFIDPNQPKKDNVMGEETVIRENVIMDLLKQTQKKLSSFEDNEMIPAEIERYEEIIKVCKQRLEEGKTWIGSNEFRDLLMECVDLDHCKTLQEGVSAYKVLMKNYLPAAVNIRSHLSAAQNGPKLDQVEMMRLGVISDMRNGHTNLFEMKQMLKNRDLRIKKYMQLIDQLKRLTEKNDEVTREMIVLKYAADQLASHKTLIEAVRDRREHLQQQFIQLVLYQIKNMDPQGIGRFLPLFHLSLLNQFANANDSTGWRKDEGNFMEDMAEIFEEMKGVELVFDGLGPFLDEEKGIIHLPQNVKEKGVPKEVKLIPVFGNISVQGSTVNKSRQQKINEQMIADGYSLLFLELTNAKQEKDLKSIEKIEKLYLQWKEISQRLQKGESSYHLAIKVMDVLLQTKSIRVSAGCMSAKDRTGVVCGRVALNHVMRIRQDEKNYTSEQLKMMKKENVAKMLEPGRPALDIAIECNQVSANPVPVYTLKTVAKVPGMYARDEMRRMARLTAMIVKK